MEDEVRGNEWVADQLSAALLALPRAAVAPGR
jgi:hypothetical protein